MISLKLQTKKTRSQNPDCFNRRRINKEEGVGHFTCCSLETKKSVAVGTNSNRYEVKELLTVSRVWWYVVARAVLSLFCFPILLSCLKKNHKDSKNKKTSL